MDDKLGLVFGDPRITRAGKAVVSAPPTGKFWKHWKTSKDKLKKAGYSVAKNKWTDDKWAVQKWIEMDEYYAMNADGFVAKDLNTVDGLLEYQIPHVQKLVYAIQSNKVAHDGSDTGTGKTFTGVAVVRETGLKAVVMCPKTVISNWWRVAEHMGVELEDVQNYEQFKTGKYWYLDVLDNKELNWNLDQDYLLIIDEAHRCTGNRTINSNMLLQAKEQDLNILMMSATLADNPMAMKAPGYALGLYGEMKQFYTWVTHFGCRPGKWGGFEFDENDHDGMIRLHNAIYESKRGSRMAISELGDQFPDNQVLAETYTMDNARAIQEVYDGLLKLDEQSEGDADHHLTRMLRARQRIELLKIPTIVDMAQDFIKTGNSVAIFVNFEESVQTLKKKLKTECVVHGKQAGKKGAAIRQKNIDDFQANKEHVIICNIRAGGVGISLHDLHGRPRISVISPTFSAKDLVQALGRIHRAGSKSPARQRIVFAANTVEEDICRAVQVKINNISALNDGDMSSGLDLNL